MQSWNLSPHPFAALQFCPTAIRLTQTTEDGPTTISGEIRGLGPGKHGIAICTYGDITPGGADLGAMFNPFGMLWSEHFWWLMNFLAVFSSVNCYLRIFLHIRMLRLKWNMQSYLISMHIWTCAHVNSFHIRLAYNLCDNIICTNREIPWSTWRWRTNRRLSRKCGCWWKWRRNFTIYWQAGQIVGTTQCNWS